MAEVPHDLKCPVCGVLYQNPYTLIACDHNVCLKCLMSLVAPVFFSGEDCVKFECPKANCEKVTYLTVNCVGKGIEIDFEASTGISSNLTLKRIAESFIQLEERLEKERIERLEKEKTIQELQKFNSDRKLGDVYTYDFCQRHENQAMELNLYCIQCDVFICHLCANKPHNKHGVISASCKDEYIEKKGQIVESIRNAEQCVDVIGSELESQCRIVDNLECEVTPFASRIAKLRSNINTTVKILEGFYKSLEKSLKDTRSEVKEPMLNASTLLKDLVSEITGARKNLENGHIRKFEESNRRLYLLQSRRIKEPNKNLRNKIQQIQKDLGFFERISENIGCYLARNIDMNELQDDDRFGPISIEVDSDTGTVSSPDVLSSPKNICCDIGLPDENADDKDLDGALACRQGDTQKKAYITSLGLGPKKISPPPIEKVDIGVQHDLVDVTSIGTQVLILEIDQETTVDARPVTNDAETSDRQKDRGIKRPMETGYDNSIGKSPRLIPSTPETDVEEPVASGQGEEINTADDSETTLDVESLGAQCHCLSLDINDISVGRFVLVSHEDETEYPWIGKIIHCLRKNVRVRWYKGELYKKWSIDSNRLDTLEKETIHASFSCEENCSQFLMQKELSDEIKHLMTCL